MAIENKMENSGLVQGQGLYFPGVGNIWRPGQQPGLRTAGSGVEKQYQTGMVENSYRNALIM